MICDILPDYWQAYGHRPDDVTRLILYLLRAGDDVRLVPTPERQGLLLCG